jgi:hypothetical protein
MINVAEIKFELSAALRGSRDNIMRRYADMFGVSTDTIYRKMRDEFGPVKKLKREQVIPQHIIDEIGKLKLQSMQMGQAGRELCTEECIQILIDSGVSEAEGLRVSTVNRRLRESGFRAKERVVRVEAAYSNQMHQLDFSRSEYFQVKTFDAASEDYVLKVSGHVLDYKENEHQLRTWLCGITDSYSRLNISRAFIAGGESVLAGVEFVNWVYGRDEDENPIRFLPGILKLDNGSLGKSGAFLELLENLKITRELVRPWKKRGIQKQESQWKALWRRFELPLAMRLGSGATINLADYNYELSQFAIRWAMKDHPIKHESKIHVYKSGLQLHEQREITIDMSSILAKQYKRRVDNAGLVTVNNQKYDVGNSKYIGKFINVSINARSEAIGELVDEYSKPFQLKAVRGYVDLGDFSHREKQTYKQSLEAQINSDSKKPDREFESVSVTDNVAYLKPSVVRAEATSKFAEVSEGIDYVFADLYAAKKYIGEIIYQNNRKETYADYAEVFDEVLELSLKKADIDMIWLEISRKTNVL